MVESCGCVPAIGSRRQEFVTFKASLGYTEGLCPNQEIIRHYKLKISQRFKIQKKVVTLQSSRMYKKMSQQ